MIIFLPHPPSLARGLFDELDVVGLYLDGGGEVALLQVDEEALDLAAALAQQGICCVGMKIIPYFLLLFS